MRRSSLQVLATNCNGFHAGSDGFEVGHHLGPTVGIAGVGGVETQSLDDVAVARPKLGCDGFGLADDGEPETIASELGSRYSDVIQRLSFYAPYASDPDRWAKVMADLKAV